MQKPKGCFLLLTCQEYNLENISCSETLVLVLFFKKKSCFQMTPPADQSRAAGTDRARIGVSSRCPLCCSPGLGPCAVPRLGGCWRPPLAPTFPSHTEQPPTQSLGGLTTHRPRFHKAFRVLSFGSGPVTLLCIFPPLCSVSWSDPQGQCACVSPGQPECILHYSPHQVRPRHLGSTPEHSGCPSLVLDIRL